MGHIVKRVVLLNIYLIKRLMISHHIYNHISLSWVMVISVVNEIINILAVTVASCLMRFFSIRLLLLLNVSSIINSSCSGVDSVLWFHILHHYSAHLNSQKWHLFLYCLKICMELLYFKRLGASRGSYRFIFRKSLEFFNSTIIIIQNTWHIYPSFDFIWHLCQG